jgi:hypothetical protein
MQDRFLRNALFHVCSISSRHSIIHWQTRLGGEGDGLLIFLSRALLLRE